MISRLGILGGMFDPVHNGHLEAARYAVRKLQLDLLTLIPCYLPNHRDPAASDANHRLRMLRLATAEDSAIEVDPIEINRGGISYTVDTVTELLQNYTQASLVFVLGADSFNSLPQWYHWSSLFELCHFMVLPRPGSEITPKLGGLIDVDERRVNSANELFNSKHGKIVLATEFEYDISSTEVRKMLAGHEDLSSLLSSTVIDYIRDNKLYS